MGFAKKHEKGLKEKQADNAKAVSACAEAIKGLVKPKVVKPKLPKGPGYKLSRLAFMAHPKLGKWIRSYMANQSPRLKPRQRPQLQLRLPMCPGLCEGAIGKVSACQYEDRWTGVTNLFADDQDPILFLKINLKQDL
ncbi:hypothetical protein STEG23_000498 [Scotinomys teguina]